MKTAKAKQTHANRDTTQVRTHKHQTPRPTLHEFSQGKKPAKNGTFAAILSTHASRSTSRRGAVLERLGPFGAACFYQGRVVDHRRALAGSQRACDASQQSACICVGSVCSGASGHFSAKRVVRFLQRRACAEGSMCRMGLSSL